MFKIFVANPNKGHEVYDLLRRNKVQRDARALPLPSSRWLSPGPSQEKLLVFLAGFQNERAEEQFGEEKKVRHMPCPPTWPMRFARAATPAPRFDCARHGPAPPHRSLPSVIRVRSSSSTKSSTWRTRRAPDSAKSTTD